MVGLIITPQGSSAHPTSLKLDGSVKACNFALFFSRMLFDIKRQKLQKNTGNERKNTWQFASGILDTDMKFCNPC
jgi:hypothetical protein